MPEFLCECGWKVYGKGAIKHSKARGNCGDASCKAAIRDGTVYVRPGKAGAAGPGPAGGKATPHPTAKSPAAKAAAAPSAKPAADPKATGPPAPAQKQTRYADDGSWITGGADTDDDEADSPAQQQSPARIAELKEVETSYMEALAVMKKTALSAKTHQASIASAEENLAVTRQELRLATPPSTRIAKLTRAIKTRQKWIDDATAEVVEAREQLTAAMATYSAADKKLERAEDAMTIVQNDMERARLEQEDAEQTETEDKVLKLRDMIADLGLMQPDADNFQSMLDNCTRMAQKVKAAPAAKAGDGMDTTDAPSPTEDAGAPVTPVKPPDSKPPRGVSVTPKVEDNDILRDAAVLLGASTPQSVELTPGESKAEPSPASVAAGAEEMPVPTSPDGSVAASEPVVAPQHDPAGAQDAPTLPDGWAAHFCPKQQCKYYFNTVTNTSTWETPTAPGVLFGSPVNQAPKLAHGIDEIPEAKATERLAAFKKGCDHKQVCASLAKTNRAAAQTVKQEVLMAKRIATTGPILAEPVHVAMHSDDGIASDAEQLKAAQALLQNPGPAATVFPQGA